VCFFLIRDCLAVHINLGHLVVFFDAQSLGHSLTIMPATPKWLNYLPDVVVGPVATTGVAVAVVVAGVPAAAFSGGAVPGKAELCPGIEYCGRN